PAGSGVNPPTAIFFGTPEFAVPCLAALCDIARVVLVVSQPDRPAGRGMKLAPPPVKLLAQERGIEVIQPTAVRKPELAERLKALHADVAVVVAYGRILPRPVLDAPRLGCVNVHASLLPKLRGAAPIQWSILRGDTRTGVCLMQMDEGMDTGPVLARRELAIEPDERASELAPRLSALGAELLRVELPRYLRGELRAVPQDHAQATLAPILTKEHGRADFRLAATELHDLVRGTHPWPGAFAFLGSQRVKLHRVHVLVAEGVHGEPGSIVRADRHGLEVACGRGVLVIDELQPDGKRVMSAEQFIAGLRGVDSVRFAVTP
ncbi:MAG TPA: methionyl-tRNA formyltransferase, partial [Polyangiales bacterium]|nr:methionyl-tRNA formyltransferase [Polyangiales bacterium]